MNHDARTPEAAPGGTTDGELVAWEGKVHGNGAIYRAPFP